MSAATERVQAFNVVAKTTDREEWLAARKGILTASDVAAALGLSPYVSPLELWQQKSGYSPEPEQTEQMEMGLRMEPVILDLYRDRTGRVAKPFQRLCVSKEFPWIGATCDAWTLIEGDDAPVELKNASTYVAEDWEDGCAEYYLPQVQTQMLVMGARRASVGCLIGGNHFVWCDVERDDAMIARIVSETRQFMDRVSNGEAPAPDGSESSGRALLARYPKEEAGKVVALNHEAAELDALITATQAEIKTREATVSEAKQRLQALIGDAEKGVLPGGAGWKWVVQEKKEYVVKASSTRVFRRVK